MFSFFKRFSRSQNDPVPPDDVAAPVDPVVQEKRDDTAESSVLPSHHAPASVPPVAPAVVSPPPARIDTATATDVPAVAATPATPVLADVEPLDRQPLDRQPLDRQPSDHEPSAYEPSAYEPSDPAPALAETPGTTPLADDTANPAIAANGVAPMPEAAPLVEAPIAKSNFMQRLWGGMPAQQPAATPAPPPPAPSIAVAEGPTAVPADDDFVIVPPPLAEPQAKLSWMTRLRTGLSKTSSGLTGLFIGVKVDDALFEELETALIVSDAGVEATQFLLDALQKKVKAERLNDGAQVKAALRSLMIELLAPLERSIVLGRAQPLVLMIAGVNGAGKTTSIGKLARHLQTYGQSVLLAAGDTFRAAAREQLMVWGQRNNVTVVEQSGGDPAAVIFDAVNAARARKIDIVMADTAGRLPTQLHLMEELRKIKRVTGKALEGAPHEILLVIDANTGQNALAQVKAFDDALGLTGLIVTKLDGTAKGGILAAIARQRPIPVYFIGVGESVEDLQPFSATEFTDALLG